MEEIKNLRNLSEYEYGALKELENIGIGNSATSLYKLTNSPVQTRFLGAKFELIENIPNNRHFETPSSEIIYACRKRP